MPILGMDSKRKETKLVGAHLSPRVYGYLSLYSLAQGLSKSEIFNGLITTWMNEQKKETTDQRLIIEIAQRINARWLLNKSKLDSLSFVDFKKKVEQELIQKGINETYIKLILAEVRK